MAALQERIQAASTRNTQLITGLHETDSAPSQLYQQINYIADLDDQIKKTEQHVQRLKKQTESELKDHKKYSESTFRRFAHKASGQKEKFEEKAAKEEREYFDAIQAQKTGEDQLAYIRQLRSEADIKRTEFEVAAQRHDELQRELDSLYASIFDGPSPGFPDEDAKEEACASAAQAVSQVSQAAEQEKHVLFLLKQTAQKLMETRMHLNNAHSASQMDLFGGGTLWSMQKRNYLERAESSVSQVRMLQQQTKALRPNIGDLGNLNIALGSIWSDVVFDNIFTDMDMHDKIKDSERRVDQARARLAQQVKTGEGRVKAGEKDMRAVGQKLQEARAELQKAREEAFARVARGEAIDTSALGVPDEGPEDLPPAYSA